MDNTLDLSGLTFDPEAKIILRNINGFGLFADPFSQITQTNTLFLYLYESTIQTVGGNCDLNNLPLDFDYPGLFSPFSYIFFGNDLNYTDNFCPIVFLNTNISFMEAYYMSSTNYLRFSELLNVPQDYDLFANIRSFKITFSPDFVVSKNMLNRLVFKNLQEFNLDNLKLAQIEEDAFNYTQRLTRIFLTLVNLEEFIRSSDNKWMAALNEDVRVNYSDPVSVEQNKNRSLVIQVNNRNSGQNYSYPDEDLIYYQYFPYDRMVFYRILTDTDIECTQTMKFLLQNALYFDPPSFLNTSSAYKCLLLDSSTSSTISTSSLISSLSSEGSSSSVSFAGK